MTGSRDDGGLAERHARALLAAVGAAGAPTPLSDHPALAWRRSGLKAVSGRSDGPGLVAPVAITAAADGALAALRAICEAPLPDNAALLLGERARLLGWTRRGPTSANGSCHLFAARGGGLAVNLARPEDFELLPAWLGAPAANLAEVSRLVAGHLVDELVQTGATLGLALAANRRAPRPDAPFRIDQLAPPSPAPGRGPLVVDLTSLWAGPLAGALLQAAGARVVKVESTRRPDGARQGTPRFFNLMQAGKQSVALDFTDPADQARLRDLISAADIVLEASRPRALQQLGVDAEAQARRGAVWVSITAHGRTGEAAMRIGFGDDAAVAGGLSAAMLEAWGEPLFAGDAIADPLTGITAALAAWASWRAGGGRLVSVALAEVVAHACGLADVGAEGVRDWQALADADLAPHYPMRAAAPQARPLGADTQAVFAGLQRAAL